MRVAASNAANALDYGINDTPTKVGPYVVPTDRTGRRFGSGPYIFTDVGPDVPRSLPVTKPSPGSRGPTPEQRRGRPI